MLRNAGRRAVTAISAAAIVGGVLGSGIGLADSAQAASDPTVVDGVVPEDSGADGNDVTDAASAAKESAFQEFQDSEEDASTSLLAAASITYTSVDVTGQMQINNYYCVPASARMILSSFGVKKTQSTLGGLLGTTTSGTAISALPGVLNDFQDDNYYVRLKNPVSSTDMFDRIKLDVKSASSPTATSMQAGYLPLWNDLGYTGNHAIVQYGYGSNDAFLMYDDPVNVTALYGKHITNKSFIYSGVKAVNGSLIW